MSEKNEIRIKLSTLLLIIAIIVIIAMAFFMCKIYNDKVKIDEEVVNLSNQVKNLETSLTNLPETENNLDEVKPDENTLNKDITTEEKFNKFMENYKSNLKDLSKSNGNPFLTTIDIEDFYVTLENGIVYFNIDKNCDLYSKYGSKYKVAENIASIYMCEIGNGGCSDLVMLGYDGSAKSLFMTIDNLQEGIKIKNIDNVKNAVSVVSCHNSEASTYIIVDIDGNMYNI